jgi:hypothetical protein
MVHPTMIDKNLKVLTFLNINIQKYKKKYNVDVYVVGEFNSRIGRETDNLGCIDIVPVYDEFRDI